MTYFRMEGPHYHRRGFVSRSCSGWEGVEPIRYGRQTVDRCACRAAVALLVAPGVIWKANRVVIAYCFDCFQS